MATPLRTVLKRLRAPGAGAVERIEAAWRQALGPAARHARLVRFSDGELVIEVAHGAWVGRVQAARVALEAAAREPVRLTIRVRR